MTLAALATHLATAGNDRVRWKLVWEFLEEYRWERPEGQTNLVRDEPALTGDERWDALLAALAEYLNAKLDRAPPDWADSRILTRPWFPSQLKVLRVQSLARAPAAFRKHGVYLTADDLEAA